MEEVMKAGNGMQEVVRYMDLDTGLREGVAKGSGIWDFLIVIIVVFALLSIVLRVAVRRIADKKTRRIILESMADDEPKSPPAARDPQGSADDSGTEPR